LKKKKQSQSQERLQKELFEIKEKERCEYMYTNVWGEKIERKKRRSLI